MNGSLPFMWVRLLSYVKPHDRWPEPEDSETPDGMQLTDDGDGGRPYEVLLGMKREREP